ncbi:MAG: TcpQ domain-containing protein [Bdellovibrionales bacterium]|jgi:hypothetical protein
MPNKILPSSYGAATLILCLAFSAAPAHAGFQWVAPNEGTTYSPAVAESYAPTSSAAVKEPEVVSPLVISNDARADRTAAETPPLTILPKNEQKLDLSTATISLAPSSSESDPSAAVVQGFATQVPLALALRQLLPNGTSFSVDQNVSIDTLVSYKGGKPWEETLNAMLASEGLVGHKQGNVITVSRADIPGAAIERKQTLPPAASSKTQSVMNMLAPVTSRAPVPSVNILSPDGWAAEQGETLHKVLSGWCNRAGVELKWLAEYDYPIEGSAHFRGGFEDAVRNLLAGFDGARPQPIGALHTNPQARQKVLVIQTRGNSYTN